MALIGKIIAMTGVATVQNDKGDKRPLHPGDQIQTGDSIQTTAGVDVDVQLASGRVIHIGSDQMVAFTPELAEVFAPTQADSAVNVATIDTVIQALENGQDINQVLEETAAGGAGGSDGSHGAVYLERINQTLNSLSFEGEGGGPENLLLANAVTFTLPFIGTITDDTEPESTSLVHLVTLESANNSAQNFAFSITGAGANPATVGADITGFSFSNGVVFTASAGNPFIGTINVPAGVSSFTVTVNTSDDNIFEGNETYNINIGEQTGTGTIVDNDTAPTVTNVVPGSTNASGATVGSTVQEGVATDPLTFTVTLSGASSTPTTVNLTLNPTNDAATAELDADINRTLLITFSDGTTQTVTLTANNTFAVSVPAQTTNFVVSIPTLADKLYEGNETLTLSAGTAQNTSPVTSAVGTIVDADLPPTVDAVKAGAINVSVGNGGNADGTVVGATVEEGKPLFYTVSLTNASTTATLVNLALSNGTGDISSDITTPVQYSFDGITFFNLGGNSGLVSVPAGVTSIIVKVPTTPNDVFEGNETIKLSASTTQITETSKSDLGTITDEADKPIVEKVERGDVPTPEEVAGGAEVAGSQVSEGDPFEDLAFTVTLNKTSTTPTAVVLTLSPGEPKTDNSDTPADPATDIDRVVTITYDNGVTENVTLPAGNNVFSVNVPAGVKAFTVSMPTKVDAVYEGVEALKLTAGVPSQADPKSAESQIVDDESAPKISVSSGDPDDISGFGGGALAGVTVVEGNTETPLLFTVEINTESKFDTPVSLTLAGLSPNPADVNGANADIERVNNKIEVVFENGTKQTVDLVGNTFNVTIPAGQTKFVVVIPTKQDSNIEPTESLRLTADIAGSTDDATGQIVDDDVPIRVRDVTAGIEDEVPGGDLVGATVLEGDPLLFKVDLSATTTQLTRVFLALTSGTGTVGGANSDTGTLLQVSYDEGESYVPVSFSTALGYYVDVPAGESDFVISVPTIIDTEFEKLETVKLAASTANNTDEAPADNGTIIDIQGSVTASGLSGQYFGYNEYGVARFAGDTEEGNLNGVQVVTKIINARNEDANGSGDIVGKTLNGVYQSTVAGAADVYFNATEISYNKDDDKFSNNLGANDTVAGNPDPTAADPSIGEGNLKKFLGNDSASAKVDAGLTNTTDAIIRLTGKVYLERGNYDFKVLADDGFSLRVNNKTLIEYDGNQAPTSREFTNLYLDDSSSGLTDLELLYWEQSQRGVLQIQYKLSSEPESGYKTLSLANLAMFSNDDIDALPVLNDTQDIVKDGSGYVIRSGKTVTGLDTVTDVETLVGSDAKDVISGLRGNDTLRGLDGADTLLGGEGDDTLEGGSGNDRLDGGLGADRMLGGLGDDIYVVDNAGDIIQTDDGGTDTVEFAMGYDAVEYTIANGLENVEILGNQNVNIIGNSANNRIEGGAGNNELSGGLGDDRLIGGQGSDILTGGDGKDVFEWKLGDQAGVGVPTDIIKDFRYTGNGTGLSYDGTHEKTDSIDLRDLLVGEQSSQVDFGRAADPGNLLNFLNFRLDGTSTVIDVSTAGNGAVNQTIVLENVNLFTATNSATQEILLSKILANGTLIVD